MTRNWNDIRWIFVPDGSLRDIYVQNVTLSDWEKLIDFLNLNYDLKFGDDDNNQIDREYVIDYLRDETRKMENKALKIYLNGISIHCHFFLSEIEFDIDPKEIKSIQDFESIEKFMISVSRVLSRQVTLTGESSPEFPLIKIDITKGINKITNQDNDIERNNQMNFNLAFRPDEAYYKEAYKEITSSRKLKKYEPVFAILMVIGWIGLYFFDSSKRLGILPFIFSGIGIYEFFKYYYEKKKWLKDRLDSKIAGQLLEFEFNDNCIKHNGPFSNGEIQWNGLKDIIKTKNGILLKPENGISIYLQDRQFSDREQIQFILSKRTV